MESLRIISPLFDDILINVANRVTPITAILHLKTKFVNCEEKYHYKGILNSFGCDSIVWKSIHFLYTNLKLSLRHVTITYIAIHLFYILLNIVFNDVINYHINTCFDLLHVVQCV